MGMIEGDQMKRSIVLLIAVISCLLSACTAKQDGFEHYKNGYEYRIDPIGVKILSHSYDQTETHITIPEEFDGNPVAILGDASFIDHKNMISVTLPNDLFGLESAPFFDCESLEECIIPKNVQRISGNSFYGCSSLTEIEVDPENEYYTAVDGALYDKNVTELFSYPEGKADESYVVPKTVEYIRFDAFGRHLNAKRVTILSNVTKFPDGNIFPSPDDVTMIVEAGSAAEQYAKDYGIRFEIYNKED